MTAHRMKGAPSRALPWLMALLVLLPAPARAETAAPPSLRETPVVRAVRAVAPAVVSISVARTQRGFFGRQRVQEGAGSGVIINGAKALVLTNAHVVEGAAGINVRLLDGRDFTAELVGSDPDFDLAVLALRDARDLPEIAMGDSADIHIGEPVIAIGNPYGYSHTVTTGVVSAMGRSLSTRQGVFTDFIQTDAAINPGNSGGPLLNILGELIGINSAIRLEAEGIGFAIPINKAKRVLEELVTTGQVAPIWLGLYGQDLDQPTAAALGLRQVAGMLVTEVAPGTPAEAGKIRPGDVIQAVNSIGVADKNHYMALMRNYTRDDVIRLVLMREGEQYTVGLRTMPLTREQVLALAATRWGIAIDPQGTAARSGRGVVVRLAAPGSPAGQLGLAPGDVIHRMGNLRIRTAADMAQAFMRERMQLRLLMLVERDGRLYNVRMSM